MRNLEIYRRSAIPILTGSHIALNARQHASCYVEVDQLLKSDEVRRKIGKRLVSLSVRSLGHEGLPKDDKRLRRPVVFVSTDQVGSLLSEDGVSAYRSQHGHHHRLQAITCRLDLKNMSIQWVNREQTVNARGAHIVLVGGVVDEAETFYDSVDLFREIMGGIPLTITVLIDRVGLIPKRMGAKSFLCADLIPKGQYEVAHCPLCTEKIPILESIAYGRELKEQNPDHPGGFTTKWNRTRRITHNVR